MEKNSLKTEIEHKLLPRLKFLAFILFFFGLGALIYGLATSAAPLVEPASLHSAEGAQNSEISAIPELKREIIYLGVSAFWAIGTSLLIYTWRRRLKLKNSLE